jgi:hypothetical protein
LGPVKLSHRLGNCQPFRFDAELDAIYQNIPASVFRQEYSGIEAWPSESPVRKPWRGEAANGGQAVDCWRSARELVSTIEYWPLIVGSQEQLFWLREGFQNADQSAEEILQAAERIAGADWFQQRVEHWREQARQFGYEYEGDLPHGEWPHGVTPSDRFTISTDMKGRPLREVRMLFVPTQVSWEIPAWMKYGGWNECPCAEEHAAAFRYWNETYGAEPAGMSSDVIEMSVQRPPTMAGPTRWPSSRDRGSHDHNSSCGSISGPRDASIILRFRVEPVDHLYERFGVIGGQYSFLLDAGFRIPLEKMDLVRRLKLKLQRPPAPVPLELHAAAGHRQARPGFRLSRLRHRRIPAGAVLAEIADARRGMILFIRAWLRGDIVAGWQYREVRKQRDELLALAIRGTEVADQLLEKARHEE